MLQRLNNNRKSCAKLLTHYLDFFFLFFSLFNSVCTFSFTKKSTMLSDVHLIVCSDNALITNYMSSSTERQVFLATWKDIPNDNEAQFQIKDCHLSSGKKDGWRMESALA